MSNQENVYATTQDYSELVTWIEALENLEKIKLCQVRYTVEKKRTTNNKEWAAAVAAGHLQASDDPENDTVFVQYELHVWVDDWADLERETRRERMRSEIAREDAAQASLDSPQV